MRYLKLSALLLFLSLASGCKSQKLEPEMVAYNEFVRASAAGDADAVYKLLCTDSRARVDDLLSDRPAGERLVLLPGWQFELDLPSTARSSKDERTEVGATIIGPLEGRTRRIPMVRENGEWRVSLFAVHDYESE